MITLEHFDEVDMRVGTITAVSLNKGQENLLIKSP